MKNSTVSNIVAILCGLAYFEFLRWMKREQAGFHSALLNRLSDFQHEIYPDVKLPGTEDFDFEDDSLQIKGLEDE